MINQEGVLQDDPVAQQMPAMPPPMASQPQAQPTFSLPNAPPAAKPPRIPEDPNTRLDLWRNLLGDFVWSLASGAEAGSKAAPGQRNQAAFAGALKGPYYRQKAKQDLELSEARAQKLQDDTAAAMARIGVEQQRADSYQQQFMNMIGLNQAREELTKAQTEQAKAKTTTEKELLQGRVDSLQAQVDKANIQVTPQGIWNVKEQRFFEGTQPNNTVTVDEALAKEAGLPPQLIGKTVKLSELTPYLKPDTAIATTEDAVQLINMKDGSVVKTIGKPRPAASMNITAPQELSQAAAEMVNKGQITSFQAMQMLRSPAGQSMLQMLSQMGTAPKSVHDSLDSISSTETLLDQMDRIVSDIESGKSPVEDSILLEGLGSTMAGMVAKGFGDAGRLSDDDIKRAKALFAGWKAANFAPDFAHREMDLLRTAIEARKQTLVDKYFKGKSPQPTKTTTPDAKSTADRIRALSGGR